MEESFELLSSMSPQIKGRQHTIKVKKVSKLALKKYFRRSITFDKNNSTRNEDMSIIELDTDSSESISSSKKSETNDSEIIANSEDLKQEVLKNLSKEVPNRVQQWLKNTEDTENRNNETFFTQMSSIIARDSSNKDSDIAACSSFNDCLTRRFDEMFIKKKADFNLQSKIDEREVPESDSSFNITTTSLWTRLEKLAIPKNKSNSCDMPSLKISENDSEEKAPIINETLYTSDESIIKPNSESPFKTPSKIKKKINKDSILSKENNEIIILTESPKTPLNHSVQEVEVMLDSIYGNSWRKKQQKVLLPLSEPKKKKEKQTTMSATEKPLKPKMKEPLLRTELLKRNKVNFENLKKSTHSPWSEHFKGLVDSDSNSDKDSNGNAKGDCAKKDINLVKTKLNFEDSTSLTNLKNSKPTKNFKNNKDDRVKKQQPKTKGPQKVVLARSGSETSSKEDDDLSTDDEYDKEIELLEIKRKSIVPPKIKTYSFLESLSSTVPINKCDMSARIFRADFKQHKDELIKRLFKLFNEKVFDNAIPSETLIEWNIKMTKTAGLCHCKKLTYKSGKIERKVRITLSTKVLDSPCRLRDTLIHEMCHAATWVVNHVSDGHGPCWKSWAFKAMETFPELPPIKRCHAYSINSKYTYRCTGCNYSIGRHTKSLDLDRKRCGYCYGKFEVLLNKTTKKGETKLVPVTPRKEPTGFALFVKENYALYKEPTKKHGDVMKILGKKFSEMKCKNQS